MKTLLFATLATTVLLAATNAFAAPAPSQQGPGRPPVAQTGPADYDYQNRGFDRSRGYEGRPDSRERMRREASRRDDYREPGRDDRAPSYDYGYDQPAPPQPQPQFQPQPRRPVAVAIQIQL